MCLLDGRTPTALLTIARMGREFHVDKLDDHFGHYEILLTCHFSHSRRVYPRVLVGFIGWKQVLAESA